MASVTSVLVAVACAAPSDDVAANDDALTGSLADAQACAVYTAYDKAELDDFTMLAASELPTPVRPKATDSAVAIAGLSFGTGIAYLIEEENGTTFYDRNARILARNEERGGTLAWSGPSGSSLPCAQSAGIDAGVR